MRRLIGAIFALALLVEQAPAASRAEEWREDIEYVREHAPRTHVDLFHTLDRNSFDARLDSLSGEVESLPDAQILVRLAGIVADIGDGHSLIPLVPNDWDDWNTFGRLPIRLYQFDDEFRVTAIHADHAEALAGRVEAIGGVPIAEVYARLTPLISRDNAVWLTEQGVRLMTVPEVLHAAGTTDTSESARFTIALRSGGTREITLDRVEGALFDGNIAQAPRVAAEPAVPIATALESAPGEMPLHLSRDESAWFAHMPDRNAMFVQINAIRNPDGSTLGKFVGETIAAFHEHEAERFIVDLRHNRGGNNYLNRDVIVRLIADEAINRPDVLAFIIGRTTYSAASHLVTYLDEYTEGVFYGEPTGASPNHYGDAPPITLPHSGIRIYLSGLYWQNSRPWPFERRDWTAPDIAATPNFDDWIAKRDPALEAIFASHEAPDPRGALEAAYETGGVDAALALMEAQYSDPELRYRDLLTDHRVAAGRVARAGSDAEGLRLAMAIYARHPDSLYLMEDIGDYHRSMGNSAEATRWYERLAKASPDGVHYGRARLRLDAIREGE